MLFKNILFTFIFVFPMAIQAQLISEDRLADWSNAGISQSVEVGKNILKATDFGLRADGISDDSPALQKVMNEARKAGAVVELPAGRILMKTGLSIPNQVILRGQSAEKTILVFDGGGKAMDCLTIKGKAPKAYFRLGKAPKKGEKVLLLAQAATFSAGDWLELRQKNGDWDVKPRDWAEYSVGQMVQVTKVDGNKVSLKESIRIDYDMNLVPEVGVFQPAYWAGVERLSIERFDKPSAGLNYNIYFQYAINSWVKGVEGKKSAGSHVQIEQSAHIEVSGSYFHHAYDYSGNSTKGYGVCLSVHASECLIVDNIFNKLRHSMMLKQGANGNVIAYNYSMNPTRSELISNYSGDISLHGHYPFANLIEGNIVQNIIIDKYWGKAGPDNTFLRNRAELYGIIYTSAQSGEGHNLVGNETTNKGWFMGNIAVLGSGHQLKCNQAKRKSNCSEDIPKSYFLGQKPSFWNISDSFPTIGNGFNTGSIPAQKRFKEGKFTVNNKHK